MKIIQMQHIPEARTNLARDVQPTSTNDFTLFLGPDITTGDEAVRTLLWALEEERRILESFGVKEQDTLSRLKQWPEGEAAAPLLQVHKGILANTAYNLSPYPVEKLKNLEKAIGKFYRLFGNDPDTNAVWQRLMELAHSRGVEVRGFPFPKDYRLPKGQEIRGYYCVKADDSPPLIEINTRYGLFWQIQTFCHELGHHQLHKQALGDHYYANASYQNKVEKEAGEFSIRLFRMIIHGVTGNRH